MDNKFNIWPYILIFTFGCISSALTSSRIGLVREELRIMDLSSNTTVDDIEKVGFKLDKSMGMWYERGSVKIYVEDDKIESVHFN